MSVSQVRLDDYLQFDHLMPTDRAKSFFQKEYSSNIGERLDISSLWPDENQNPHYFMSTSPPRFSYLQGELLWLVPMDLGGPFLTVSGTETFPYPEFAERGSVAKTGPMRYIGTIAPDGKLIFLAHYNKDTRKYTVPYTVTLAVDFEDLTPDLPFKEGKWAYHVLETTLRYEIAGCINYSLSQIDSMLNPHS